MEKVNSVLVTGGAGYVGSSLIPKLLDQGYLVKVVDLFIFGESVFNGIKNREKLELIKGDIRDQALLKKAMLGCDAVIHLACISNDPSFELNPILGRSINFDAFSPLVDIAKNSGVSRFIYASSSSVYGIRSEQNVTEELSLKPLTEYSKYKALCEDVLLKERCTGFTTLVLRPATVCGYAPRLRLDLTVNILTNHAVSNGKIKVFGGGQLRPNIHVEDMSDLYVRTLELPSKQIDGKIFNAGYENHSISEIAEMVKGSVGENVLTETTPTDDLRSYHISSNKIKKELGFCPKYSIKDAINSLLYAFDQGKIPNSLEDKKYYNIKTMQELNL
jgi:nucleoside-diphosphate-sugar epimerase